MKNVLICLACSLLLSGCNLDTKLTKVCEKTLKEHLKAPSTYKRIAVEETVTHVTVDSYKEGYINTLYGGFKDQVVKDGDLYIFQSYLKYDSSNSFGVPIRDTVRCQVSSKQKAQPRVDDAFQIVFDGKSYLTWRYGG